ncbi:MAG: phosphatase [Acidocella sp. 20-57-95]|nr:MAG: phosphatase [Acidocella sp. 20-57-95]OYV58428.1 MAG: phosphatase [Acidocella sp. 21-58-7]HQT64512.1 metallophosphoesterase [Acidocella sp.]HQU04467.1 metallophosphoesterase [Acidocella sp.]
MIPAGRGIRIVGDVHGDSKAFSIAADTDLFVIQLGDLVDDGPDTPGALEIMFRLVDERRGLFLLGNHDFKLARALRGDQVFKPAYLHRTLDELSPDLAARAQYEIMRAPAWVNYHDLFFVHGGFHPAMLTQAPPPFPEGRADALLARALYGQTTGRVTGSGRPERLISWVNRVPANVTVYCGHDRRSTDHRPHIVHGAQGGTVVFLDTGAGKGGHLSWIDIPTNHI